jgi:hypothetical protein
MFIRLSSGRWTMSQLEATVLQRRSFTPPREFKNCASYFTERLHTRCFAIHVTSAFLFICVELGPKCFKTRRLCRRFALHRKLFSVKCVLKVILKYYCRCVAKEGCGNVLLIPQGPFCSVLRVWQPENRFRWVTILGRFTKTVWHFLWISMHIARCFAHVFVF